MKHFVCFVFRDQFKRFCLVNVDAGIGVAIWIVESVKVDSDSQFSVGKADVAIMIGDGNFPLHSTELICFDEVIRERPAGRVTLVGADTLKYVPAVAFALHVAECRRLVACLNQHVVLSLKQ